MTPTIQVITITIFPCWLTFLRYRCHNKKLAANILFPITDHPSVKVDHLASDVSNVGGATAFYKQKESYDLKFPPSPKDRNGTVFSHSVGTINSLAYPTSSTKHKMHHSSSNSISSLDALNSKDPLKR